MEQVVARENAVEALKRVRRNKGSPGIDGMTVEELTPYLREHWSAIREQLLAGTLPAERGEATAHPEERGRDAAARHSDRARSFRPAAAASGAAADLRSDLQRAQPRLSTWAPSTRRGARSAAVHPGRKTVGGRRGSGEVLRPREPRRADGKAGESDRGRADAADHPPLSGGRHHGRRSGGGAARRNAARRTSLTATGKRAPRRSGQGVGATWAPFVRYADDCNMYVRSKRAGERVLAVLRQKYAKLRLRINEEKSAVARVWDRKFLGYSFWVAPGGEVKRRVSPKALEGLKQRVRANEPERWTEHGAGLRDAGAVPTRLEGILQAGGYTRCLSRPRQMAPPPTESDPTQTVEAGPRNLESYALGASRVAALAGAGHGRRWWWASVRGAASGSAGILRTARSASAGRTNLNSLNRRMRTRMSGGVGGE